VPAAAVFFPARATSRGAGLRGRLFFSAISTAFSNVRTSPEPGCLSSDQTAGIVPHIRQPNNRQANGMRDPAIGGAVRNREQVCRLTSFMLIDGESKPNAAVPFDTRTERSSL